ncbi:MAG: hypothetical protein ABJ370_16490 [Paracoccaceae bacterium]
MTTGSGYHLFPVTSEGRKWAEAANSVAEQITSDEAIRASNMRHGDTWFVGVDALPTGPCGEISGVECAGAWQHKVPDVTPWHKAQLSVVYPGYPKPESDQSQANHAYRIKRAAAHVDGLLPIGPDRRRYPREFHAFVLGLPLNASKASPTVCWDGSHKIMGDALRDVIGDSNPRDVDVTQAYHDARKVVFDSCKMVELRSEPGAAFLLHRFALHGTAPWSGCDSTDRRIAFFRPEFQDPKDWLRQDW